MLDIKRIRQNPQELRDALKARNKDISIDEFLAQDEQRRKLLAQVEEKKALRNATSKKIGEAKKRGASEAETAAIMDEMRELGDEIAAIDADIADLDAVFAGVRRTLKPGGVFLFNIEHPSFTAGVRQEWIFDSNGRPLYWPIDDYFLTGERSTSFPGCEVRKQHHTLTQILMGLLRHGFEVQAVEEAQPSAEMLEIPGMKDELRRPMMLLVKAGRGL